MENVGPHEMSRRVKVSLGEQFSTVLDAAKTGADWAWELLYDECSPVVLGYVRGRGAAEPEDLVAESFLHAVRAISSFSGDERGFRAWMLGIAHRRLVDDWRYRSRRPLSPATDETLEAASGGGDVEEEALARTEGQQVLACIRGLSPDQQDVLLLRLVADLSLDEVASTLGKRISAVKALQRRGLARLHKELFRQGVSR
jgi:RNA polymerase sigma factor (sigma-70 family)